MAVSACVSLRAQAHSVEPLSEDADAACPSVLTVADKRWQRGHLLCVCVWGGGGRNERYTEMLFDCGLFFFPLEGAMKPELVPFYHTTIGFGFCRNRGHSL